VVGGGRDPVLSAAGCHRCRAVWLASIRFRAMGVLDDAIREHFELKRKHGAPEEELQRQEEEALGPVRREVAPPDELEVEGDGEPAPEPEPVPEPEESIAEPAEPVAEPAEPVAEPAEPPSFDAETSLLIEPRAEPFPEEEAPAVPQAAEPIEPLPEPEESEEDDALAPAEDAVLGADPRTAPAIEGDEDGDRADAHEPSGRADDVLEDTPDFLEETPEHDRLWFEQKPPRDFDFD
jgi:hypothetical protein